MKHLVVLLSLLLLAGSAQAQTEKAVPVSKLPGEENLSLRERAERDFLMPVRRKKAVTEAPKPVAESSTAAPETDASAHFSEATDEAALVPAHTTRSYEARHTEAMAARRSAARREEARAEAKAEARAEARRAARYAARHHSSARSSKSKSKASARKAATRSSKAKASKSKTKTKSAAHTSKSKTKASAHKASARKSSAKKTSAHHATKKASASKSSSKSHKRRH